MQNKELNQLSYLSALVMDLLSSLLTLGPVALSWLGVIFFIRHSWDSTYFYFLILLVPVVGVLALICSIFVFRMLIPKLKQGIFPIGFNRGVLAWTCHLALSRSAEVSGFKPMIQSFYLFKFLYWRACGAKISFLVNSSIGVSMVDLSLITVGQQSTLSDGVHISCHTFVGDRLFIAPVVIGKGVFLGMHCLVGPRSKIGDSAWIGAYNKVFRDQVGVGERIPDGAWEKGNPKKMKLAATAEA